MYRDKYKHIKICVYRHTNKCKYIAIYMYVYMAKYIFFSKLYASVFCSYICHLFSSALSFSSTGGVGHRLFWS